MSITSKESQASRSGLRVKIAICMALALGLLALSPLIAQAAATPTLKASLVDAKKKAVAKTATVQVTVSGVNLVDPDTTDGKPKDGEGHLHYKLDNGPVIATTTPKLSFHGVTSGAHSMVVMLAGNNHEPLGPQEVLTFDIP